MLYNGKLSLQLEELLLYSLPLVQICNFTIGSPQKFPDVWKAICNVYDINFDCISLRNYFYRSSNNLTKGKLRWKYYFALNECEIKTDTYVNAMDFTNESYKAFRIIFTAKMSKKIDQINPILSKKLRFILTFMRRFMRTTFLPYKPHKYQK